VSRQIRSLAIAVTAAVAASLLVGAQALPGPSASAQVSTRDGSQAAGGRSLPVQPSAVAVSPVLGSLSPLGTGMSTTVRALAWDAAGDTLYAGGSFSTAGGLAASRIAAWADDTWTPLSTSGISGSTVYSLALDVQDDTLYAAGTFTTAGGLAAGRSWGRSYWGAGTNLPSLTIRKTEP